MKRVWVTRAQPGARATAARLSALGFEPLVLPVLEVRTLPARIDLGGVAALAFTSANGVAAFAAACAQRRLPVFAVGDASASAARAAGFAEVASAAGDVAALAGLIAAAKPDGAVLHPGAAEPAGELAPDGVEMRALALYETVSAPVTLADLGPVDGLAGVLIHSPKAARRVAEILAGREVSGLHAWCISPAAAANLTPLALAAVAIAPLPNEEALLSLVAEAP
jgi:uroporphyrinogen-III synthase